MYTTSTAYKTEIQKRSRTFECRVTIGDRVFTNNEVQSIDLNGGIQDVFSIGNTPSVCLELVLRNTTDTIFTTNSVKVEIGLKIGNTIEYIPLGIFNIEDIKKDDYTTKFTCYDNMSKFEIAYFSSLGDTPTLQQVVNELASKTGVQFIGSLPAYNVKKLEGFTCREVLGYVASLCGGNAIITRDGKFTIVYPTDISKDIGEGVFDLQRDEVKYKVGKITCQVKEQETISKGSLGTDNMELSFENPWVTETILTDIYNRLNAFNYLGYTMKWQGDSSLDIGDIITYIDVKGVTRKLPILYRKLSYDGGLDSELSAKGETKNKNSFSSSGSMSNKVNRLVTEQAVIKEALIEKANIEDLKATNAEIANLKVKDTEIENALIKKATIEQLNATNANIQNLIAEDARINNLVASKASITELNAVSAKIGTVEADTAIIKDLLAGNVTAGSGQIIHLTAKNVTMEDAVIKNLIAAKLSVADLQAGTISTNKFTIASTDGGLNIVGPTIQWKDKNNKIRMQAGKDAQGNFTFLLVGEDGTTALLDQTGIKQGAIANDLIVSDMISENAIGEKQINYSSLITGLNKDDNTSLIKASKVAIDLTGQSLEVAFNSLKSNVDNKESRNLLSNTDFGGVSKYYAKPLGGSTEGGFRFTPNEKIENLIDYTISARIRGKANLNVYQINTGGNWSNLFINRAELSETEYRLFTLTFQVQAGKILNEIYICTKYGDTIDGDWFEIEPKSLKLEKGNNKVPNWTPAPEDIDSQIESNTTSIEVAQGKIEGLIKESTIIKGDVTSLSDKYTSINATVNGLNSTVASHTSSISTVTTELGKIDGKINTAKSDAISTAGADATSKANNALSSAKSYTNAQITTVNTRVSNAESSITQLNNSITNKVWQTDIDKSITIANTIPDKRDTNELPSWYRKNYPKQIVKEFKRRDTIGAPGSTTYGILETTIPWLDKGGGIIIQVFSSSDGTYERRGSADDTTWGTWRTIEDTVGSQNKIDSFNTSVVQPIKTEVTTVKEKAASLETSLNSITSKVTNLESTTSTINGKVTAQETRLQSTEQKVTATGVITTITEAINAGTNSLTTMQFILDKNGATIKNGALRILNKAGTEVLKGDSNGNLTITGTFINYNYLGVKAIEISDTNMYFYDWEHNGRDLGLIYSSYLVNHPNVRGFSLSHSKTSYLTLSYENNEGTYTPYLAFDKYATNPNYKGVITAYESLYCAALLGLGDNMYLNGYTINFGSDTKVQLYKAYTTEYDRIFMLTPTSRAGDGFQINSPTGGMLFSIIAGRNNLVQTKGAQFDGNVLINGNYRATGTKSNIEKTKNYGEILSYAVEATQVWKIDYIGGKTDEYGECIVALDDMFIEYANTDIRYYVSLQEEGEGKLYPCEYNKTYFKVKGTPNLCFNAEIRALRKEYEDERNGANTDSEMVQTPDFTQDLISNLEEELLRRK